MWKRIFRFLLITIVFSPSICSATINPSRIAIGGVTPYSPIGYAKNIYGNPQSTTTSKDAQKIKYGNFEMTGVRQNAGDSINDYLIVFIYASKPVSNNIATPDGVTVGMDAAVLNRIYGQADKTEHPNKYS